MGFIPIHCVNVNRIIGIMLNVTQKRTQALTLKLAWTRLKDAYFCCILAFLTLCFILLHTFWGVVFFAGLDRKNYIMPGVVFLSHMLVSCLVSLIYMFSKLLRCVHTDRDRARHRDRELNGLCETVLKCLRWVFDICCPVLENANVKCEYDYLLP